MQVLIKISLEGRILKEGLHYKKNFKGQQKMSDKCQTFDLTKFRIKDGGYEFRNNRK